MIFDTIHWLPEHLSRMREWQEICKAYDYLLEKAFKDVDEIQANQFLDSLTEMGCLIWERLLGLSVTEGETLEERRQTINSYLSSDLPYTENKLREVLENLAGPDAVKLTVSQADYEIKIDLTISTPSVVSGTQEIVYRMRPSNMVVRITISYDDKNKLFVGHAIKEIKKLSQVDPGGAGPYDDFGWLIDTDGVFFKDELENTLIE